MPPEETEIRSWVTKAQHDRSVAKKIIASEEPETDMAAFHCQQAVEKLLKAYLVSRMVRFPRTHDLRLLFDECCRCGPEFEALRDMAEPLTAYAVAFRYPGPAEPTREDVIQALDAVEAVWLLTLPKLPGGENFL